MEYLLCLSKGLAADFSMARKMNNIEGVLHTLQENGPQMSRSWIFLRKFGWLKKDEAIRAYSAKFKPKG